MENLSVIAAILKQCNQVLSSAIVITAFSLLVYILTHNLRSPVARAFSALIAFVTVVYTGDVALYEVQSLGAAVLWLKFQWLGIAFVPAAYLHFSHVLLCTTNDHSRLREAAVVTSYLVSLGLLIMAFFTDWLVRDGVFSPVAPRLQAGPLFWMFTLYFFATVAGGLWNIRRARRRCLTSTSRRRMTYLSIAFVAPGMGVFPYLLVTSRPAQLPHSLFLLLLLVGNVAVALMLVVMAYSVAYFGVLTPDRVVKHSLIHFLLRGPFVATCVIVLLLIIPKVETILGLPRDTVTILAVVVTIVLLQVGINLIKPFIDRLIYRQDQAEITWIQELDKRLLTTTDLRQFLENILIAMCDLLRVPTAFIISITDGTGQLEAYCGSRQAALQFLHQAHWIPLVRNSRHPPLPSVEEDIKGKDDRAPQAVPAADFTYCDGFWVRPLRTQAQDALLGLLAIQANSEHMALSEEEREGLKTLVGEAEAALEDRLLQQGVFAALQHLIPEIERIQRRRGTERYLGSPAVIPLDEEIYLPPDLPRLVKDALSHYWGGPKLSQSPLLELQVVRQAMEEHDGSPVKALRAVLNQAIEALRPEGQRRMTTKEWILYNILDLKFMQGKRMREIAMRLAMSESDLYRKQRVAIEEVARTIANMEKEVVEKRNRHSKRESAATPGEHEG